MVGDAHPTTYNCQLSTIHYPLHGELGDYRTFPTDFPTKVREKKKANQSFYSFDW